MKKLLFIILVFMFCYAHSIKSTVQDLGPFDRLVVHNNTIFFISARPCSYEKEVVLTIMRIKEDPIYYHYNATENISKPIRLYTNKSIGFILDLHTHDIHEIHATIKEVNINAEGKLLKVLNRNFLDVIWKVDHKTCRDFIHEDIAKNNTGFQSQDCTHSNRQGDFSTLCYMENTGIYITVMNICDVPYSVNVVSILPGVDTTVLTRKYTAVKDDSVIPITDSNSLLGADCGLVLSIFHGHMLDHKKQHVVLKQMCTNPHSGRNMTLIDDSYYTVYGQLCGLSKCSKVNNSVDKHSCEVKMRNITGFLVNSVINIELDVCNHVITGNVEISIDGFPKSFKTTMKALPIFSDKSEALVYFNYTKPGKTPLSHKYTGFMPLVTGQLSLSVQYNGHQPYRITLFRHYVDWRDRLPLVHDQFYIDKKKFCIQSKKGDSTSSGLKAWVIVVIVICVTITILSAVTLCRWWRNRSRYKNGFGLPYHIELNDNEFSLDGEELSRY